MMGASPGWKKEISQKKKRAKYPECDVLFRGLWKYNHGMMGAAPGWEKEISLKKKGTKYPKM